MGTQAAGAILDALGCIGKITAAAAAQRIQRTVAKQAAEALRITFRMARKVFTLSVLKKIVVCHGISSLLPTLSLLYWTGVI